MKEISKTEFLSHWRSEIWWACLFHWCGLRDFTEDSFCVSIFLWSLNDRFYRLSAALSLFRGPTQCQGKIRHKCLRLTSQSHLSSQSSEAWRMSLSRRFCLCFWTFFNIQIRSPWKWVGSGCGVMPYAFSQYVLPVALLLPQSCGHVTSGQRGAHSDRPGFLVPDSWGRERKWLALWTNRIKSHILCRADIDKKRQILMLFLAWQASALNPVCKWWHGTRTPGQSWLVLVFLYLASVGISFSLISN